MEDDALNTFPFECACEKYFSSKNTLFKICQQYSMSARDCGYINREGYENDYEECNSFQVQITCIGVILL